MFDRAVSRPVGMWVRLIVRAGLEQIPPARKDSVHACGAEDGAGRRLEMRRVEDEWPGLGAADASVKGDELLEGAPFVELGVVKAADPDVRTCWKPSVRRRCRGAVGENGASGSSSSTRPSAR